MPTTNRKSKRITITPGERAAVRSAEEALRMGLPNSPTVNRHLTNAKRKMDLMRYGKAQS
jgi:hypothetical protein